MSRRRNTRPATHHPGTPARLKYSIWRRRKPAAQSFSDSSAGTYRREGPSASSRGPYSARSDGTRRGSEGRRVGKEGRTRWAAYHLKKKKKRQDTGENLDRLVRPPSMHT